MGKIFAADKTIRMGIWGLGRGRAFIDQCKALNIEIVAGCDLNKTMCADFRKICPGAFITQNEDEFLACDMDAVLVATYFFAHADDAIKALNAGKHVLSEVSAFFTPAEGVRLVEAVEKSGKLYALAENYADQFVKKLWQEGVFGELAYAEFDYVHECRPLCYSYLYGDPMIPGNIAHSWRSWLNLHYYCTHSLGAAMEITGTRPVKVCAPPSNKTLPGYLPGSEIGAMKPSFVTMDNGGIVRNLMGASTADSHTRKIWGTRAYVDLSNADPIVRLGQCGRSPAMTLSQPRDEITELASKAGHGGGDFYVLYNFANSLLHGTPGPWDIYRACDVTLTGIMAVKSEYNGGIPVDVPDFRDKAVREAFRNDHFRQMPFDPEKIFPDNQNTKETCHFANIMNDLDRAWTFRGAPLVIAAVEGMKLYPYMKDVAAKVVVQTKVQELLRDLPSLVDTFRQAKHLMEKYAGSPAAEALRTFYESAYPEKFANPEAFREELISWLMHCNLSFSPQLSMSADETVLAKVQVPECPQGFALRKFREGDEEGYVALMKSAGFYQWDARHVERVKNSAINGGIYFVEESTTGHIVATAMTNLMRTASGEEKGELGWVAVHPDFRGKHLAEIVSLAAMQGFREAGYKWICLRTDDFRIPAIKTYLKMGWKPIIKDETMNRRWDRVYKRLGMEFDTDAFNNNKNKIDIFRLR